MQRQDNEYHKRQMNMNAHLAWGLAFWSSGEVNREQGLYLVAPVAYYYSIFHTGFALLNTNLEIPLSKLSHIGHTKLQKLLTPMLPMSTIMIFDTLRQIRETVNYLGIGSPAGKLRVVRGHPFGFKVEQPKRNGPGTEEIETNFFQAINEAATSSKEFIETALQVIETRCEEMTWRGPKRNDSDWFDEYLGEDLLLNIIPREVSGRAVLMKMLSLIGAEN